jgi:hypothetical protein
MMHNMQFDNHAPALTQLLAASLKLMTLMREHHRLLLYIPKHVHDQLTQADFGRVLYDLLSAQYPDLENRLEIRVHGKTDFLFLTQPPGALHEIS